jgi:hypothetical protein
MNLEEKRKLASAAIVEKYAKKRLEYQEMGVSLLKENDPEFLIGCALYWAEGSKRRGDCVFVNSDPKMMTLMISFFRKFFNIPDEKFTVRFNCHLDNGLSYQDIEDYWLDLLELPKECIRKSTIKANSTNRKVKHPYGMCSLRVCNGTVTNQAIFGAIKKIAHIDKDSW